MSSPDNWQRPFPLLPICEFVCPPGQVLDLKIPSKEYHEKLFQYAQKHTYSRLAIAYIKEETADSVSFYDVMTVVNMNTVKMINENDSRYWVLQVSGGVRATVQNIGKVFEQDFYQAYLEPYDEHFPVLGYSQTFFLLMPLWTQIRRLSACSDCYESLVPSHGNRYFSGYMHDLPRFLEETASRLSLTYPQQVTFMSAKTLSDKVEFLLNRLRDLAKLGGRFKITTINYEHLCRINRNALPKKN